MFLLEILCIPQKQAICIPQKTHSDNDTPKGKTFEVERNEEWLIEKNEYLPLAWVQNRWNGKQILK